MNPPTAPFEHSFDSIEVSASTAPSRAAIEHAFAICASIPHDGEPGFYLLDNAGGRFVVDREFGVISLKEESLLERERGFIHAVRLKVIEPSGLRYELDLQLRICGVVPQVLGYELEDDLSPRTPGSELTSPWTLFSPAVAVVARKAALDLQSATFGAPVGPVRLPPVEFRGTLEPTSAVIAPAPIDADWSC